VVSNIETFAFKNNPYRTDNAPHIATAHGAFCQRIIRHSLSGLEFIIALLASIKISWHGDRYPELIFFRVIPSDLVL
jgi:hypothetical protein